MTYSEIYSSPAFSWIDRKTEDGRKRGDSLQKIQPAADLPRRRTEDGQPEDGKTEEGSAAADRLQDLPAIFRPRTMNRKTTGGRNRKTPRQGFILTDRIRPYHRTSISSFVYIRTPDMGRQLAAGRRFFFLCSYAHRSRRRSGPLPIRSGNGPKPAEKGQLEKIFSPDRIGPKSAFWTIGRKFALDKLLP